MGIVSRSTGGVSAQLTAEATLTDAQIKALGSGATVQLVAAPAAGSVVVVLAGFVTCRATAGAYSAINANATLGLVWVGGTDAALSLRQNPSLSVAAFLGGDAEVTFATLPPSLAGAVEPPTRDASEASGFALALAAFNGGIAFGGGNAANSLRAKVWYSVEVLA